MTGHAINLYLRDGNFNQLQYYIQSNDIVCSVDDDGNYCVRATYQSNPIDILKIDRDMNLTIYAQHPDGGINYWALSIARMVVEPLYNIGFWGGWEYSKQRIWTYPRYLSGYTYQDRFNQDCRMFLIESEQVRFDKHMNPISGMTEITKADWDAKMEAKRNVKHRLPKRSRW